MPLLPLTLSAFFLRFHSAPSSASFLYALFSAHFCLIFLIPSILPDAGLFLCSSTLNSLPRPLAHSSPLSLPPSLWTSPSLPSSIPPFLHRSPPLSQYQGWCLCESTVSYRMDTNDLRMLHGAYEGSCWPHRIRYTRHFTVQCSVLQSTA